jgi:8-oxo-dGTP diphosphatase
MRVAIAVVVKEGKVLLLRRKQKESGLDWCFPGGIVEAGETPQDAAMRETEEETGIVCGLFEELGNKRHPTNDSMTIHYWAGEYVSGDVRVLEPEQHEAVEWVAVERAKKLIGRDLTPFIRDFFLRIKA